MVSQLDEWKESSTKEQWHLSGLMSFERAVPIPDATVLALKLVHLVFPHISLVLFKLLTLYWSLE